MQRPLFENTLHPQETDFHAPSRIWTCNPSTQAATDLRFRPPGYWDHQVLLLKNYFVYKPGRRLRKPGMIHQAVSMQPITPPTTSIIISTKCTTLWSVKTFFDKLCFQNSTKERKILLSLSLPGSWTARHWCFCRLCHCEVNKVTYEAHQASFSIQEISAAIRSLNSDTFTGYISRYSSICEVINFWRKPPIQPSTKGIKTYSLVVWWLSVDMWF
jgi:hypothetical protein